MRHTKKQIKSGFFWSALDNFGSKILGLVITIVLANVLGPSDYGLVAMLTIFIAIANVFVNSGFNSALIRKLDRNEKDYSTTFYFSLFISVVLYGVLFFLAPAIAGFYQQNELIDLTRVIALTIIINTFSTIPRTKLTVALNFKDQAKANVAALLSSGGVGIYMAFNGFGVWALVLQQVISVSINVVVLNLLSPWKPIESFCKNSFKELFGFGSKLLISALLETIYSNLYGLIIGKYFSAMQLGMFNQAKNLSSLPATTITSVIQRVTYPMLSAIQNDRTQLDDAYLITLKISTMIVFPIMFGICITSEELIDLLLGEQWQDTAPLISVLSMAFVCYPISAINLNLLQVKGRSDLFLKIEIIKKINVTVMLFLTVPMGVYEMCIGMVITSFLAVIINTYYTARLSSISQIRQLLALLPTLIITIISSFIGYISGRYVEINWLAIGTMLATALLTYMTLMFFFQASLMSDVKKLLKAN